MSEDTGGVLYVVSTPIGNLKDVTYRAVDVLSSVDEIASEDTRVTKVLLNHYNIKKPLLSYNDFNKEKITPSIIKKLRENRSVALVSDSGTPGVSDPLYYLVTRAINEGITVIPVPGASSLLAGIVVSGLPNDRFVFEGFLPPKKGRKTKIAELEQEKRTIVLFESPHRLLRTLRDLKEVFGNRRISIGRELTKIYEEVIRTDLGEALDIFSEKKPRGEFVLIIEGKR